MSVRVAKAVAAFELAVVAIPCAVLAVACASAIEPSLIDTQTKPS